MIDGVANTLREAESLNTDGRTSTQGCAQTPHKVPNQQCNHESRVMISALVFLSAACATSVVGLFYDPRCPQREHRRVHKTMEGTPIPGRPLLVDLGRIAVKGVEFNW
ncbi:uncharacterized protein LOC142767522 [Rhipicephalus microplus]|uniref:uncharacterized protein LOC142767522 n=1 Tax=Rhipicephalus microplus TaxID=6941 RepID=UPI003F6B9ABA